MNTALVLGLAALFPIGFILIVTGMILDLARRPHAVFVARSGALIAIVAVIGVQVATGIQGNPGAAGFLALAAAVLTLFWLAPRLLRFKWESAPAVWVIVPAVLLSTYWLAGDLARSMRPWPAAVLGTAAGAGSGVIAWPKLTTGDKRAPVRPARLAIGLGLVAVGVVIPLASGWDISSGPWNSALFWGVIVGWSVPVLVRGHRRRRPVPLGEIICCEAQEPSSAEGSRR